MELVAWLLESDPSVRWQVLRDIAGATEGEVAAERARVGHGARLLAPQEPNGYRSNDECGEDQSRKPVFWSPVLLRLGRMVLSASQYGHVAEYPE